MGIYVNSIFLPFTGGPKTEIGLPTQFFTMVSRSRVDVKFLNLFP